MERTEGPSLCRRSALNHLQKNYVSDALPHDVYYANLYVYVCGFVNIHIFRNMCMGADIYKNTWIWCISVGFVGQCFPNVSLNSIVIRFLS